jgi:hypothetical protein
MYLTWPSPALSQPSGGLTSVVVATVVKQAVITAMETALDDHKG